MPGPAQLQALSAASAGVIGPDLNNRSGDRGILVYIDITAISGTSPTLTVNLEGKDEFSGKYYTFLQSAALTAVGVTVLRVYPGLTAAANLTANDVLPGMYRVRTTIGGTSPSVTATINAFTVE